MQANNNFTAHHRKIAFIIALGARQLAAQTSRPNILRLTIAPTSPADWQECQRRFKSLATHPLKNRACKWMMVAELRSTPIAPQPLSMQFHLLVAPRLSSTQQQPQWRENFREILTRYGFKLLHACPADTVKATQCFLVAKYQAAVLAARNANLKGARLVRFSHGWRNASPRFAWHSAGGWLWRAKLARFAQAIGARRYNDLKTKYGSRWAYHFAPLINAVEVENYPTLDHAEKDGWNQASNPAKDTRIITVANKKILARPAPDAIPKLPAAKLAQIALRMRLK
jgi:hypothetical protein